MPNRRRAQQVYVGGRLLVATLGVIAALALLPKMAWCRGRGAATGGLLRTNNVYLLAAGAVVSAIGGALLKLLADNFNGRIAARREFIKESSGQVSKLAKEHYWALANDAGVLAGMLEEYLHIVDFHLLLEWDSPMSAARASRASPRTTPDRASSKLCRLLWLFDKFQFEESNTYLTTTDPTWLFVPGSCTTRS